MQNTALQNRTYITKNNNTIYNNYKNTSYDIVSNNNKVNYKKIIEKNNLDSVVGFSSINKTNVVNKKTEPYGIDEELTFIDKSIGKSV